MNCRNCKNVNLPCVGVRAPCICEFESEIYILTRVHSVCSFCCWLFSCKYAQLFAFDYTLHGFRKHTIQTIKNPLADHYRCYTLITSKWFRLNISCNLDFNHHLSWKIFSNLYRALVWKSAATNLFAEHSHAISIEFQFAFRIKAKSF